MKYVTSVMMLLLASTLATANEPQEKAAEQSLVLAYNTNENSTSTAENNAATSTVSRTRSERALNETLGEVSANLSVALDERIAATMPTFAK
jgi:hypothetical protein